jgi:eukaryotic-like serine/threonine-protein kinase
VNEFDPHDDDDDAGMHGVDSSAERRARAVEELVPTEIVPAEHDADEDANGDDPDSSSERAVDFLVEHTRFERLDGDHALAPEAIAFEELADRTIGDFRILRRLGQGGMAEVYLAEQVSLNRNVALKILRAEVLSGRDDILLRRFRQEAKAAAALTHQNIVQVYGVGDVEGLHFIAQEYVHGINLKQFVGREGPPDAALAIRFAKQIALALQAAADAGIVHRDVKPENVMITPKGMVKVADFGLAQLTRDENVQLTQVGMTMGTPLYMSPEQVHGHATDARSDLYSFGVTLWHVLAGEPPFRGETAMAIAIKHLNEAPPRLHDRRADLPRSLCDLVHRMMAKSPADRPPDAGAVFAELKRIGKAVADRASGLEIDRLDRPVAETTDWWEARRHRQLVRHVGLFAVACLVTSLAAAGAGWWSRPADPMRAPVVPTPVEKQKTAEAQAVVAKLDNTEQAWQAVVDYFGRETTAEARRWVALARLRLGLIALSDKRYEDAQHRFHEVSTDADVAMQNNGTAGLAMVLSQTGDHAGSQKLITEGLRERVDASQMDREMRRYLYETIRRNRQALGGEVDTKLEEMFRPVEPTELQPPL